MIKFVVYIYTKPKNRMAQIWHTSQQKVTIIANKQQYIDKIKQSDY